MTSSAEEDVSIYIINTAAAQAEAEGGMSYTQLAQNIEKTAQEIGVEKNVVEYVDALRTFSHDAAIAPLPDGIGGLYDGSITIATSTVEVGSGGVEQTVAQMQEVYDHELYHAVNNHTDAMMTWGGEPNVVIAGQEFSTTEVIEGLTVTDTGEEFVSEDYQNYAEDLQTAVYQVGLTLNDVRRAVNDEKDFTKIDDRKRVQEKVTTLVM